MQYYITKPNKLFKTSRLIRITSKKVAMFDAELNIWRRLEPKASIYVALMEDATPTDEEGVAKFKVQKELEK